MVCAWVCDSTSSYNVPLQIQLELELELDYELELPLRDKYSVEVDDVTDL
jgi:hypothetical protein